MIDRQHNRIVIECDACGNVHEGKSTEWNEVWPEARREGWKAQMAGSDWVHICPECKP